MSFHSFGLLPQLSALLEKSSFREATPIQAGAIPAVLAGRDVLGIARTGSGKTASYVLPILQNMSGRALATHREPTVLVLVPTRELADQVHHVFQNFVAALPQMVRCRAVYGGVSINPQMKALAKVDILVATPGRLLDLVESNAVQLSAVSTLVLDEADKILNLGFQSEVNRILSLLPKKRQNLLFSATLSADLSQIQQVLLEEPVVVKIEPESQDTELIEQVAYAVTEERKGPFLRYLLREQKMKQALIFASSTFRVDAIVVKLCRNQIRAGAIHSKMAQQTRQITLRQFKEGLLPVLVSTDLLARGVDIEELPYVINYELPRSPKDYIHRIGRTGRADRSGVAISLVSPDEEHHFKVIQKKMKKRVPLIDTGEMDLNGF
ncbi:DEAD/DEAH box helicase [Roseibacillus persicicus]|uniref:DEAD/DEAH box helicase n=1 Tax=Roseibacillus persicicus TaxID=454148 RepID=UPI00281136EE|nr:DEAD/DEAH box helicase [Roseibacillus persicicus]